MSTLHGITHLVEVDGQPHRITHDEGGIVRSPAPAVVVSIDVEPGDRVAAGDRIAVLEAMKMETAIEAEFAGVVEEVLVQANAQVGAGAPILVISPDEDDIGSVVERVAFDRLATPSDVSHDQCRHFLDGVRQMLLGFDVEPGLLDLGAADGATPCQEAIDAFEAREREEEILGIFADIAALFRREPGLVDDPGDRSRRTTED